MFAFLFPGQGSQFLGMLSELSLQSDIVKKIFSEASDVLHYDLWDLTQNGPVEKLNHTEFTQPALLAADMAVWGCWKHFGGKNPQFVAGHSLGEYAALVCAEAITFQDAIALVSFRGKYMQSAVAKEAGAMAAIIGLEDHQVEEICKNAATMGIVCPANYNAIGQITIAGETAAVEKAIELAKDKGAKLAKIIPVSVPSHCVLMQPAADQMAEKLKNITIKKPQISVIQNADVKVFESSDEIRDALIKQLISPVRWVETIRLMIKNNCQLFFECGPGKILAGLNKRISREICTEGLQTEWEISACLLKTK